MDVTMSNFYEIKVESNLGSNGDGNVLYSTKKLVL